MTPHDDAAECEMPCPLRVSQCPQCIEAALDAGIPLAVIEGKKRLRDLFTQRYVDMMCGREPREEYDE